MSETSEHKRKQSNAPVEDNMEEKEEGEADEAAHSGDNDMNSGHDSHQKQASSSRRHKSSSPQEKRKRRERSNSTESGSGSSSSSTDTGTGSGSTDEDTTDDEKGKDKKSDTKKRSKGKASRTKRRSSSQSSGSESSDSEDSRKRECGKERRRRKADTRRSTGKDGEEKSKGSEHSTAGKHKVGRGKPGEILPASDKVGATVNQNVAPGRTGGVYIPPFKMARLRKQIQDKSSEQYQRLAWDDLRKGINGVVNKVNITNMTQIIPELFSHNLVRGRGLLARAIMKAQLASPGFTHIYAALVSVINTKMPENGELLLKRVVLQFRRSFRRNDKVVAVSLAKFVAHLLNQQVAHEILALQLLTLLLERPTDSSVEVAVDFVKQCGQLLMELTPQGLHAIFERFRSILHEGQIDKRVQFMIEALFAVRKSGFADYPRVLPELDLVESDDQITHEIGLDDKLDREEQLDVFKYDPHFEENERLWDQIKKEILGEDSDESEQSGDEGDQSSESDEEPEKPSTVPTQVIEDKTETDVVSLRRTIYLTIMSSLSHDECAHKLLKLDIPENLEHELVNMLIECCSQERTYLKYFGLLGQRFCLVKRSYQEAFETAFADRYSRIHRLDTNKLRNVAKFFAHLLGTDALPWTVFEFIRLNEDETNSSSRIFLKILLQELMQTLGIKKLRERFRDPHMGDIFAGLFPKDSPRNARFAINYFTSIGLGALTDDLRQWLREAPKQVAQSQQAEEQEEDEESESSSGSSSDSGSDSESSSGSEDSSSSHSNGSEKSASPKRKAASKRKRSSSQSSDASEQAKRRKHEKESDEKQSDDHERKESSGREQLAESGAAVRERSQSNGQSRRRRDEPERSYGEHERRRRSSRGRSRRNSDEVDVEPKRQHRETSGRNSDPDRDDVNGDSRSKHGRSERRGDSRRGRSRSDKETNGQRNRDDEDEQEGRTKASPSLPYKTNRRSSRGSRSRERRSRSRRRH